MIFLLKEQIYLLHNEAIEQFGGEKGYFNNTDDKIESILSQQFGYFGVDKYPTVFDKCAMLTYFFVKDHCFRDGNKRVAAYIIQVFLDINGYELTMNDKELEDFIIKIAESNIKDTDKYIFEISETIKQFCE